MALKLSQNNQPRELIPEGMHTAICIGVVDLGTQEMNWQGQTKVSPKIRLMFELCDVKRDDGKPFTTGMEATASMYSRATLRKMLESWRNKPFTDEEADGFELSSLVGKPCTLWIAQEVAKNGNTYANIKNIKPTTKGVKVPQQVSPSVIFDLDPEGFRQDVYDALPQFLKDKIAKSPEYTALVTGAPVGGGGDGAAEADASDIF